MIKIIGPRDKRDPSAIDTTSHSAHDWSSGLSPFKLGPLSLYDNHTAHIFENAWQFAKLYPEHADSQGNPRPHIGTGLNAAGAPSEHTVTHSVKDGSLSAHSGTIEDLTISPLAKTSTCHSTKRQ